MLALLSIIQVSNIVQRLYLALHYRVIQPKWTFCHPPYLWCRGTNLKTVWGGNSQ